MFRIETIGRIARAVVIGCSFGAVVAHAAVVTVTNGSPGWQFHSTDDSGVLGTGTANTGFVNGPGSPPSGTGSAHLMTAPGAGNGSAQLRSTLFGGVRLDSLTTFNYSTYVTAWNGQQATYLTLWLDLDGNSSVDDRIHFEPAYSSATAGNGNVAPQADPALGIWQTWNLLTGMWYNDNGPAGPGSNAESFADYLSANPDATIVNPSAGVGGVRFTAGFGSDTDNFDANVDAFTVGIGTVPNTVYDFEASAVVEVPEPGSLALMGLALAGLVAIRKRKN